jgi:uncharacterized protein YaeQ
MSGKYSFRLRSEDFTRPLPGTLIIGQQETETPRHILLKLLAYLWFYREGLRMEPRLHDDNIPFRPDVVQLDYQLRPVLWVECGECSIQKLDRLAVKVNEAEIWVLKRSRAELDDLIAAMRKAELRTNRYRLACCDAEEFDEAQSHLATRNDLLWVGAGSDPESLQFDLNGLWFDLALSVTRF